MEHLTLNRAWELCLEEWVDVVVEWLKDKTQVIPDLKAKWMRKFDGEVWNNCFFCEYSTQQPHGHYESICQGCPGKLVDKTFRCFDENYDFETNPDLFLAEIRRLDQIRRSTMTKEEAEIRLKQNRIDQNKLIEEEVRLEQELKEEEVTYSIGDRFKSAYDHKYILIALSGEQVVMGNLGDGCHWGDPRRVGGSYKITQEEFDKYWPKHKRYWDSQKKVKS
jgi:hypothetical protein